MRLQRVDQLIYRDLGDPWRDLFLNRNRKEELQLKEMEGGQQGPKSRDASTRRSVNVDEDSHSDSRILRESLVSTTIPLLSMMSHSLGPVLVYISPPSETRLRTWLMTRSPVRSVQPLPRVAQGIRLHRGQCLALIRP